MIDLGKANSTFVVSCARLTFLLVFVYFASYTYFTSTYFDWMPNAGVCGGEEFAAFAGMGILSSYLLLFISFYFATYQKSGQKGRKRSNTARKAAIDMSRMEVPTVDKTKEAIIHSNGSLKANGHVDASGRSANGPFTKSRKA